MMKKNKRVYRVLDTMMKFNSILKEEKKGKTITLTNMDRKMLNLLQKQKVDPKNIDHIILFFK